MRKIGIYVIGLVLAISHAWAAEPQATISLAEASRAAGINMGAQQRLLRAAIDLPQLALGLTKAYSQKPDEKELALLNQNILVFSAPVKGKKDSVNKALLQSASFDLGIILGIENQDQLKLIDVTQFMDGFKSGYGKNTSSASLAAASVVVNQYIQQQRMLGAEQRLEKSRQFLQKNASVPGVIVTASGLQYEILQQSNGAKPNMLDMVTVNYRHSKPDSDFVYDSAEHGHSETMAMRGAIPDGWRELFLLMNKGSRYRVYLPPALGFAAEGNGDALLPNEVLITEFTLLDIIPPPAVNY